MTRILASLLLLAAAALGDDKVWSAVVLASNPAKGRNPMQPPAELAPYAAKLTRVFGYEQFEILGSATKAMDNQKERWLVPSQNFWVGAQAVRDGKGYVLDLEFFHDKRRLIETKVKLDPNSPLFVRGPVHPLGQVIVVFEVRR